MLLQYKLTECLAPSPYTGDAVGVPSPSLAVPSHRALPTAILESMLGRPLYVHELALSSVSFTVSVRASVKLFINVDNAPVDLDSVSLLGVFAAPREKMIEALLSRYSARSISKASSLI